MKMKVKVTSITEGIVLTGDNITIHIDIPEERTEFELGAEYTIRFIGKI